MTTDRPIILLHGLGSRPITMLPLLLYLKYWGGYKNIHNIKYEINTLQFDEALDKLDSRLITILDKGKDKPIVIGQSMGGLMANSLHKKGWSIHKSICIGSPLHGARILNYLHERLPTFITKRLQRKSYDYLMNKERDECPPHECHTISMSWPFLNFDGCVFTDETKLTDDNHTHIKWADHRTVFASPRLWKVVLNKVTC